jgi:hypothetical protein
MEKAVMKDSGKRQSFDGGAVRDTDEGKPQWYLVSPFLTFEMGFVSPPDESDNQIEANKALKYVACFQIYHDVSFLVEAFTALDGQYEDMVFWLMQGAAKYSPRNWERGINISRCIDSLCRHLDKLFRGITDEDHKAAAKCNIMFILHYCRAIENGILEPKYMDIPLYCDPSYKNNRKDDAHE